MYRMYLGLMLVFISVSAVAEHANTKLVSRPKAMAIRLPPITSERPKGDFDKNPQIKRLLDYLYNPANQKMLESRYKRRYPNVSLLGIVAQWQKDHPGMTPSQLAYGLGVLNQGGMSVFPVLRNGKVVSGKMRPEVCQAAYEHAADMARKGYQHHDNFGGRSAHFAGEEEINKQTFEGTYDILDAAFFCANWDSAGHRGDMMESHAAFCYDMVMRSNGAWFCTGIFSRSLGN